MATYPELVALAGNDKLRQQIKIAIAVAAQTITNEAAGTANHAQRVVWAKTALGNPDAEVERVKWYVLAANAAATPAQITGADDPTVQAQVNAAVNLFAT